MTATMLPDHPLTETEHRTKRMDAGSRDNINGVNCCAGYVLFSDGSHEQLTAWMDQDGNLTETEHRTKRMDAGRPNAHD